jgi:hypothetical protein
MWQGQPLDLLRRIHEEVHLQNTLEASGYRSPTWRILRALQSIIKAKVLIGESTVTAAPFFEGAGRPLETVAKKAEGESAGWTVKLIIFVGGTRGSMHVQAFNSNLKKLGVVESKRNAIRRGFVHELLNAQDTVLCSYFAQRAGTKNDGCGQKSKVEELFQGLERFE